MSERRRQELQRHLGRRARRFPRCVDRSRQHRSLDRRRRRRPVVFLRRRQTWWKADNLPISQFYHVSVDMDRALPRLRRPAGQQLVGRRLPISRRHHQRRWENMYGGDGFWVFADPSDPDYIYAESQGGNIGRVNRKTHESPRHQAAAQLQGRKAALQLEHADSYESQREGHGLHRRAVSVPFPRSWPDLGAHLAGLDYQRPRKAEAGRIRRRHRRQFLRRNAHHHLFDQRIAQRRQDHLGRHRRRQRAGHPRRRQNLDQRGRQHCGFAEGAWVSSMEASHFDAARPTRRSICHTFGDMRPHVYKTSDYGKTWTPRRTAPAKCAVTPTSSRKTWSTKTCCLSAQNSDSGFRSTAASSGRNTRAGISRTLPCATSAMHPRDYDLVIATHGRGIWIIDDITPLRKLTPEMMAKEAAFVAGSRPCSAIPPTAAGRTATRLHRPESPG